MKNNVITRFLCVIGLVLCLTQSNISYAKSDWRLEKNEDEIQVFLRSTPGSAVKSFKGKIKIKTTLSSLVSILDDSTNFPRWLYNTKSAKVISRNGDAIATNYIVTNMPWPVVDRDAVIISKRTQNPTNKRVEIKLTTNPNQVPKVQGKVRIQNLHGRWLLTPMSNNVVDVIYEMSIDPGGNIPKWIVNAMSVDLPFNTLKNLKKISKEPKYANAKVKGVIN